MTRRTAAHASGSASSPPPTPSATLSSSSDLVSRPRVSPSAARIASSPARPSERTRKRFATFAQVISRRNPTAPSRIQSVDPMSPTTNSRAGRTSGRRPAFARNGAAACSGNVSGRFDSIVSSSACTCVSDAPAAIRPMPCAPNAPNWSAARLTVSGLHSSAYGCDGTTNPGGVTPTTSTRSPSMSTTRPTASGSPPNRRRQRSSLRIATRRASPRSSSTVKARPIRGCVRATSKNDAVTRAPSTRSGLPGPVKLAGPPSIIATLSSVRLSSA